MDWRLKNTYKGKSVKHHAPVITMLQPSMNVQNVNLHALPAKVRQKIALLVFLDTK
jgi:hypothetical protein